MTRGGGGEVHALPRPGSSPDRSKPHVQSIETETAHQKKKKATQAKKRERNLQQEQESLEASSTIPIHFPQANPARIFPHNVENQSTFLGPTSTTAVCTGLALLVWVISLRLVRDWHQRPELPGERERENSPSPVEREPFPLARDGILAVASIVSGGMLVKAR